MNIKIKFRKIYNCVQRHPVDIGTVQYYHRTEIPLKPGHNYKLGIRDTN